MAKVVEGAQPPEEFASQATSLRDYVEGLRRIEGNAGKSEEELLQQAYSAFKLDPLTASRTGITPETTLLPPEQRADRAAFEGSIPGQLAEAGIDALEVPVSMTGYAGGILGGALEHMADVPAAAYTGLTGTPTPSGMAGARDVWGGTVSALKGARDGYDQSFRVPIIELLVESGVPQSDIDQLVKEDNDWLRAAKAKAPTEYRGFLPEGKFAHNFSLYESPLYEKVNGILTKGGSSLKDVLGPEQWNAGSNALEGLHALRSEYEYAPQNRVLRQIKELNDSVSAISQEDRSFFTDLGHDWDEIRNSSIHLISDLMGATEFQPHYRHLASQGVTQRLWARFQQSFEGGQEFASGIVSGYGSLLQSDFEMARNKPLLTFMLALPVLKAAGNSPRAFKMRQDMSKASLDTIRSLRDRASRNPALASLIEKADGVWNKEVGGLTAERPVVKGDRLSEWKRKAEGARDFEGRSPYTVGHAAAAATKGAIAGAVMGVPEVGAGIGAVGSLIKARYRATETPGAKTQERQAAGRVAEEGRQADIVEQALAEELYRRRQARDEGTPMTEQVDYFPEADLGTEAVRGEIVLGADEARFSPELARVRDLEAVETPDPLPTQGRTRAEAEPVGPPRDVSEIPILDEAGSSARTDVYRGRARQAISKDLNNLIDKIVEEEGLTRDQAIQEIANYEIPDTDAGMVLAQKAMQYVPDQTLAELVGTFENPKWKQTEANAKHAWLNSKLMEFLTPEEMFDAIVESRIKGKFEPNFQSGLELFVNEDGVLDTRPGPYIESAQLLQKPLERASRDLGVSTRDLMRDVRFDGSVIEGSRLAAYLQGKLKRAREWEKPPAGTDLRPDPTPFDVQKGTNIEPQPTGPEVALQPRDGLNVTKGMKAPLERGTQTERAFGRQEAARRRGGDTKEATFRQPFVEGEVPNVSFKTSKTVRSQAESGLRRAAQVQEGEITDSAGRPIKTTEGPEGILRELDQLETDGKAEYRVVHVKKKTTVKGAGVDGADVTLNRGYVVYDAKTNSLVPNVLIDGKAVIQSVTRSKGYTGSNAQYAAGRFIATLKRRKRDVQRASVEKTDYGTKKQPSPPPKGEGRGRAAPKKSRQQKKDERAVADRDAKVDKMNDVERAIFLAEEEHQARVDAGEPVETVRSDIGGFHNPGPRSATKPPPKGKKGKKGKRGQRRKSRAHWTDGDSEYKWNRARSTGSSGRASALADFEKQMESQWLESRNHKYATPDQARNLKRSIINQQRALDRRAKDNGQYGEAVEGFRQLLDDTQEAIRDSLEPKRKSKGEKKPDYTEETVGVKDPVAEPIRVSTRMAKVLTLNDLMGLEKTLQNRIASLVAEGTRSGKRNQYSAAAAKIRGSSLWMKIRKAPLDVLDRLAEKVARDTETAKRPAKKGEIRRPMFKTRIERDAFEYLLDKLRREKRYTEQRELIGLTERGRKAVKAERGKEGRREKAIHGWRNEHFGHQENPSHTPFVKKPSAWETAHGPVLTPKQLSAKLRKMQRDQLGEEPTTLAQIMDEADRRYRPEPEATTRLRETPPGSESTLGPDGKLGTTPNTSGGFTVSKFLKGTMARVSKRMVRKAGFMKGSETVLSETVRSIFRQGTALLMSPTLRGIAKQETMARVRKALDDAGETYDKNDLVNLESALDQYFEQFNRPFYAEGDAGAVTHTMARVPDRLRVRIREGADGILLDMSDVFDSALNEARRTKSKDVGIDVIQDEAVAVMTKMLSNDARKNTHFKVLSEEATRLNITGDLIDAVAETFNLTETEAGKIAYNKALTDLGRTLVAGIFSDYTNPANGLPLAPSIVKDLTAVVRGTSAKTLAKWIDEQRKEDGVPALTAAEKKRILGEDGATRVTSGTQLGKILNFYDSFQDIGMSPSTVITKPFSRFFGDKDKSKKPNEKVVKELNLIEEELFGPNTMYRDRAHLKYQKDFSVSPDWNESIWWEATSRMGMAELMTIWGANAGPIRKRALDLHRMTKGVMTTMNPSVHGGNKVSNHILVMLLTGEGPFAVERRISGTAWGYLNYLRSKATFGREKVGARAATEGFRLVDEAQTLKEFREANPELARTFDVLHRQGLEMGTFVYEELRMRAEAMGDKALAERIRREFGEYGVRPDRTPSMGRTAAHAGKSVGEGLFKFFFSDKGFVRKGAMKLYNFEDVSYRIGEFVREFSDLDSVVNMVDKGSDILIQSGDNTYIKIFRDTDGKYYRYKNNKKSFMDKVEMEDIVGRAAMYKVNRIIFNYADIPKFVKFMRDIPFSPMISPFITWAWKALDIPGAKRGLMAATLFEKPPFLSNDPKVLAYANRKSFNNSLRRSLMISGALSEMNELDHSLAQHSRFSKELGGYGGAFLEATHRAGVMRASSTRGMDPFKPSISGLKILSTLPTAFSQAMSDNIPFMTWMAPKYYTKEQMKGLSKTDKHVALLRKAYLTNNGLNRREMLNLFHISESPALGLTNAILLGKSPYHDGKATVGDVFRLFNQMFVGEGLYRLYGSAMTLMLNPDLKNELMNDFFPHPRRMLDTRSEAWDETPSLQRTQFHPESELAGNLLIMLLEYIQNLGSREVNFSKRGETMLKDLQSLTEKRWLDGLRKQRDALDSESDEYKWYNSRIDEIGAVLSEHFEFKSNQLNNIHRNAYHHLLNPAKRESDKAVLTHGSKGGAR